MLCANQIDTIVRRPLSVENGKFLFMFNLRIISDRTRRRRRRVRDTNMSRAWSFGNRERFIEGPLVQQQEQQYRWSDPILLWLVIERTYKIKDCTTTLWFMSWMISTEVVKGGGCFIRRCSRLIATNWLEALHQYLCGQVFSGVINLNDSHSRIPCHQDLKTNLL